MNIPSLEFYVESIRHLTSSIAIRRQTISLYEDHFEVFKNHSKDSGDQCLKRVKKTLTTLRAKQKHEKSMLAYFVAQQRDILDYYKATEELYEETL